MCAFDINITESADTFVANAKAQVEGAGGTFNGDTSSGSFNVPTPPLGHVSGTYTINGATVSINIDHHGLIPCGTIEDYVKSHL
jgi:hypothetical protein